MVCLVTGQSPDYFILRAFGCISYVHVDKRVRRKLSPKAETCVFVGYSDEHKGYRCFFSPKTGKMVVSRHVTFDENHFNFATLTSSTTASSPSKPWCTPPEEPSDTSNGTGTPTSPTHSIGTSAEQNNQDENEVTDLSQIQHTPAVPSTNPNLSQSSDSSNESASLPNTYHQGGDQVEPAEQGNAPRRSSRSVQPRRDFPIENCALQGSTITEQSSTKAQGTESVLHSVFLSTSSQDSEPTSFREAASDPN